MDELAAHAIFFAAGAHALAALLHHFMLGNPVLARIGIARARR